MYDESIEVKDAEEVRSPTPESGDENVSNKNEDKIESIYKKNFVRSTSSASFAAERSGSKHLTADLESDLSDNTDDDDDDDDVQAALLEGSYDPKEYEHLSVPSDVKDVFQYITCYIPQKIELEYKLRPFIPDFIPAVGDIDAFVKVGRPDYQPDNVGLFVLDEPCANQSDPAVLCLQLRASTKQTSAKPVVVKKVENAENNSKAIERWIHDINELHKNKPAPTVQYTRNMPDIDNLMQEWPPEFEKQLNQIGLPIADLDCDLPTLVDIICSIFDIPRYESRVESLHVLFMLYLAIKNSQFQKPENYN